MNSFLFLMLIPIGIFLLVFSILNVIKFAKQKMIYEVQFQSEAGSFSISNAKRYGVWLSGKAYAKSPAAEVRPSIINDATQENIKINLCIRGVHVIGMDGTGRVRLCTFKAKPGQYSMSFVGKGRFTDRVMGHVADALTIDSDYSSFSIQIREYSSPVILFLLIWGIVIGAAFTMFGFVLPFALR